MSIYRNHRMSKNAMLANYNELSWVELRPQRVAPTPKKKRAIGKRLASALAACAFIALACFFVSGYFDKGLSEIFEESSIDQSTPQNEWQQGVMPHLYQTDSQWSDHPYAGATFGESGCGPISLAAVSIYLTGDKSISPTDVSDMAESLGYASSEGTAWEFMTVGASMLGIYGEETTLDEYSVREQLDLGHPIICIMGAGDFTTTGHFIVISGMSEEGLLAICDSNSAERSAKLWSLETIQEQCRSAWVYSASGEQGNMQRSDIGMSDLTGMSLA